MKNVLAIALLLPAFLSCSQQPLLNSEWVGHISLLGQTQFAKIKAATDTLTLELPDEGPEGVYQILHTNQTGGQISFQTNHQIKAWYFIGKIKGDNIYEGNLQVGDVTGKFTFYKTLLMDEEDWQPYLGNYKLPSGDLLCFWQRGRYLRFHSAITMRNTGLKLIGPNKLISTSGEILIFSDLQNGKYRKVQWQAFESDMVEADRTTSYKIEDHLIITSTDTIGASLYLPDSPGPHPACIIPIGAARYDRYASDLEAELFASNGIATLIYDNYGYGKSSGDLMEKSFVDKQNTAVELFRWLQSHPQINQQKIGFRGASQGGRIALMAASSIPETAFLALVATPMETRMDQQLYAISAFHRQQNQSEEAIAHAAELWRKFFRNVASGKIDSSFVQELQIARDQHPDMELPNATLGQPPHYTWKDDILNNTSSYVPTVKCPVLCVFGALDDRVPAQKSISQLQSALEKAGQSPAKVVVYQGLGHSFMLPGYRIVPGLFMNQINFMKEAIGKE